MCRFQFYLSLSLIFLLLFSSPVTPVVISPVLLQTGRVYVPATFLCSKSSLGLHRIVLSKASTFCPSENILAMTCSYSELVHTVTEYRLAFICTEASLYGAGELQRHLHSLLSCFTCGIGRTAFCSSTMVPFCFSTGCQMWSLYVGGTGKVTLQLWTETFPCCLCWPLQWANLEMSIMCYCYRTPAMVCASTQREQAQ